MSYSHNICLPPLPLYPSDQRGTFHASPLRFVIAEDDDDLRFIVERLLGEAFSGSEIAAYANGKDALEDFDRHGACLVVSNHSMPVMDGPTFVSHLRERSASLPILMVSGTPEARHEGQEAGISCFLDKDEMPARLTSTVRALLEQRVPDMQTSEADLRQITR